MRTSSRLPLVFSCLAHTYAHLTMLLYPTVVLALDRVFALPYDELVALSLPGFILFGAGALPAGWLGDRWSGGGMMAVFFLGTGAAVVVTGLAGSPLEIAIGLALVGLFASIYHPVGIAWLVRNAANRGRALGINGVFGSVGTAGGALVAGGLTDLLGWRAAFIVPGTACIATGLVFVWVLRRRGFGDPVDERPPSHAGAGKERRLAFGLMAFTIIMIGLIYQSTTVGLPKLMSERFDELAAGGTFGVGLLVAIVYVVAGVAQLVGGELADRHDLKRIYVLGLVAGVPFAVVAATAGRVWFVGAAAMMMALQTMIMPAENALLVRYTPIDWRARMFGLKFLLALGVSSVGVALVPLVHRLTGSLDALYLMIAAMAAAAGIAASQLPGRERAVARAPGAQSVRLR